MDPIEIYKIHVEECRFQVDLTWRRSQYFFVLNVVILIAGLTLIASKCAPWVLVVLPFAVGVVSCVVSIFLTQTGHSYYRAARDRRKQIADRFDLSDIEIASTPGGGSGASRKLRIITAQYLILGALGVADAIALIYGLWRC